MTQNRMTQNRTMDSNEEKKSQLQIELWKLALEWLDVDCAVSSVLLGTIAALKIGASHELAIYLLDFSKSYMEKNKADFDSVCDQIKYAKQSAELQLSMAQRSAKK